MAQFERLIVPSELEAAGSLRSYIADVQDSPPQVVNQLFHFGSGVGGVSGHRFILLFFFSCCSCFKSKKS